MSSTVYALLLLLCQELERAVEHLRVHGRPRAALFLALCAAHHDLLRQSARAGPANSSNGSFSLSQAAGHAASAPRLRREARLKWLTELNEGDGNAAAAGVGAGAGPGHEDQVRVDVRGMLCSYAAELERIGSESSSFVVWREAAVHCCVLIPDAEERAAHVKEVLLAACRQEQRQRRAALVEAELSGASAPAAAAAADGVGVDVVVRLLRGDLSFGGCARGLLADLPAAQLAALMLSAARDALNSGQSLHALKILSLLPLDPSRPDDHNYIRYRYYVLADELSRSVLTPPPSHWPVPVVSTLATQSVEEREAEWVHGVWLRHLSELGQQMREKAAEYRVEISTLNLLGALHAFFGAHASRDVGAAAERAAGLAFAGEAVLPSADHLAVVEKKAELYHQLSEPVRVRCYPQLLRCAMEAFCGRLAAAGVTEAEKDGLRLRARALVALAGKLGRWLPDEVIYDLARYEAAMAL